VPRAPIAVVSWHVNDTKDTKNADSNLHVRVYTVLASSNTEISELSYQNKSWVGKAVSLRKLHVSSSQPVEHSSIAATRNTKAGKDDPIRVFYQPRVNVIDLISIANENTVTSKDAAEKVELPQGIPTSRGPFRGKKIVNLSSYDFIVLCGKCCV